MSATDAQPWWWPVMVDDRLAARLREDYPENAVLSDAELFYEYGYRRFDERQKYAVTWDTLGDAYEQFEQLADAFLALQEEPAE